MKISKPCLLPCAAQRQHTLTYKSSLGHVLGCNEKCLPSIKKKKKKATFRYSAASRTASVTAGAPCAESKFILSSSFFFFLRHRCGLWTRTRGQRRGVRRWIFVFAYCFLEEWQVSPLCCLAFFFLLLRLLSSKREKFLLELALPSLSIHTWAANERARLGPEIIE